MVKDLHKIIGLKIDVDTSEGMKQGVPRLLDLLNALNIRASFFVPMGKDHTGWTAKRVFTRKGFLKKVKRVGVVETYGIKTLMYGLLLPGPNIAKKNRPILQQIIAAGHEAGIHGYDHVSWHDHVCEWNETKTLKILRQACTVYEEMLGQRACSFAAPGWMINPHALGFLEKNSFLYSSDTRGVSPFLPDMGGRHFGILQIPTTLPTLDEVVGIAGDEPVLLSRHFVGLLTEDLNILTIHAELEGNRWTGFLKAFIQQSLDQGFVYKRLNDIAMTIQERGHIPRCTISYGVVEGRAGDVSCQNMAEQL
jgi:peptidoglycan/xylan/chitin deacetylase (PgdA/CDA1 family)